jgi:hypothetical protein
MKPFRIDIPQAQLDDLQRRLPTPGGQMSSPLSAGAEACR